ncbi:hypothetical protein OZX74_01690 [Bifidobacterium sp. ESL0798]|uniref:hypothetical protein n=1 Tax=Bifidobacterium sp. ESL0798 TaxID=2983235 RepID=UPI0023F6E1B9|nr:hypothetical protein [Bifidobacterium sp. ESL0798]WEV74295.1 hypothetical protein OZX74_01690 [Bifidobacterium sp. ESL0798]
MTIGIVGIMTIAAIVGFGSNISISSIRIHDVTGRTIRTIRIVDVTRSVVRVLCMIRMASAAIIGFGFMTGFVFILCACFLNGFVLILAISMATSFRFVLGCFIIPGGRFAINLFFVAGIRLIFYCFVMAGNVFGTVGFIASRIGFDIARDGGLARYRLPALIPPACHCSLPSAGANLLANSTSFNA